MAGSSQRLKRWESPRKQGRNDKGRGGAARQRQKQKQLRALRLKLKEGGQELNNQSGDRPPNSTPSPKHQFPQRESPTTLPFFNVSRFLMLIPFSA